MLPFIKIGGKLIDSSLFFWGIGIAAMLVVYVAIGGRYGLKRHIALLSGLGLLVAEIIGAKLLYIAENFSLVLETGLTFGGFSFRLPSAVRKTSDSVLIKPAPLTGILVGCVYHTMLSGGCQFFFCEDGHFSAENRWASPFGDKFRARPLFVEPGGSPSQNTCRCFTAEWMIQWIS